MAAARTTARITGVVTVGIPVTDQDRALEFYVGTLGFEKQLDVRLNDSARWIVVAAPGSASTTIALEHESDHRSAGVETGIRLATPDAGAANTDLKACGVDVDEVLRWPGVPAMFAFRDQDGNGLEIVQDLGEDEVR